MGGMKLSPHIFSVWLRILSGPRLLFWLLPLLMILLVIGTMAQKTMGIVEVQAVYFSSFIVWFGPIPFPGGATLMGLFLINLVCKFLLRSEWTLARAGTHISHFGVIILVFGGLMTALDSREGYLVLQPDTATTTIEDYHQRVLAIYEGDRLITTRRHQDIIAGVTVAADDIPFTITIDTYCYHCGITRRPENVQEGWTAPGKFMQLQPATPSPQDEANMTGVEFTVLGAGKADGKYLTFDKFPKPPEIKVGEKTYTVVIERAKRSLPFQITLKKFTEDKHPGTDMARAFSSDIIVTDGTESWPAHIAMNDPLRYRGYTMYQSSFDTQGDKTISVLSVVENSGRLFPYIASALIAIGLIFHLIVRAGAFRPHKLSIPLLVGILCGILILAPATEVRADTTYQPRLDTSQFSLLPILHDGRLKPLESFARTELKKFSGKETLGDMDAMTWLATVLFDPAQATNIRMFAIPNANIRHQMGVEERKIALYSLEDISKGLQKTAADVEKIMASSTKKEKLAENQSDLLTLHENALEATYLLRSFSMILPLSITLPSDWDKKAEIIKGAPVTYLALKKIEPELEQTLRRLIKTKGQNPDRYNAREQKTALLGLQISTIASAAKGNNLLRVIPSSLEQDTPQWVAPWELMEGGAGTPTTASLLTAWQITALAWQEGDAKSWDASIEHLRNLTHKDGEIENSNIRIMQFEKLYLTYNPFRIALFLFTAALVMAMGYFALARAWLLNTATLCAVAATGVQAIGILARVIILERPPVGTLYESMLFVGLVAPCIALGVRHKLGGASGQSLAIIIASTAALLTGLLAVSFAGDEDTMKVLAAVLNTRFWLATHVLCITIGYGWCIVTAILAHIYLIGQATQRLKPEQINQFESALGLLALFSLLFTAVGTILGGIWADQSWGRFWGWDPKENGALLIVLWLVWIIHGKLAGQMSHITWATGLSALSIIVAFAWIGVNLLGIGLHSYGFMDGVFGGLGIFTIAECLLLGTLYYRLTFGERRHHHAA